MNLPAELVSLLTDEAYAALCQDSLSEALKKIRAEKEQILVTRPPFGMLATSETRQVFQTSLRAALDNETGLQTRLDQLSQIDLWLKVTIENTLHGYLPTVSAEYRICYEACAVVSHWDAAIEALHEKSLALARDARAVVAAINPVPVPNAPPITPAMASQTRMRAITNLRTTIMVMQAGIDDVMEVRNEFAKLCDTQADGLQLPLPPAFRNLAWVDRLAALTDVHCCAEAVRCETEARAFCAEGMKALLAQGNDVREACLEASKALLSNYWRELRDYAQANYVKERDLDEVIAELAQHRLADDVNRRQTSFEMSSGPAIR